MSALNESFGRYELLERLGEGKIFEVFKAKSFGVEGFEKKLVVKRVHERLALLPDFLPIFVDAAKRAVRLSHANVAQVFDLGSVDGSGSSRYFVATEFVAGVDFRTLLERIRVSGPVSVALCLYVAAETAKALDHAHRRRDEELKPLMICHGALAAHNVLVSWEGDVKVTDFGMSGPVLASHSQHDAVLVPLYSVLSPEQASGEKASIAGDLFSLGTMLYEALTGSNPFAGKSAADTLTRVQQAAPVPLGDLRADVPGEVVALVGRLLARDPSARPASASHAYEELMGALYAVGETFGQRELAAYLDTSRGSSPSLTGPIGRELGRPLTVRPHLSLIDSERPSLPPMAAFAETRHATALVVTFHQRAEPLPELVARAKQTLSRYGGHLLDDLGNEVRALFGIDRGDGRDTEAAVRAGLVALRELSVGTLRPAVGVHSGRVRVDAAGRVLLGDDTAALMLERAHTLAAKVDRRVVLSRRAAKNLLGRYELESIDGGFTVGRPTRPRPQGDRFVGRRAELAALAENLAAASRGAVKVVVITGDHGIGKTRLLEEMRRRLGRGSLDLGLCVAVCPPRGRDLPLSGVGSLLRRLCGVAEGDSQERIQSVVPRLRSLGLGPEEVDAVLGQLGVTATTAHWSTTSPLATAVARMFQALSDDRFQLFVWDDAQELDVASVELVQGVVTRLASSRVALVFAGRNDESAPYKRVAADLALDLGELDEGEAERLLAARLGVDSVPVEFADFVLERAGGHPMFIEELVREAVDTHMIEVTGGAVTALSLDAALAVPRTLRALLSGRVQRLPALERDVVIAAAILDAPVRLVVLAAMLERPLSAIEAAVASLESRGLAARDVPGAIAFPTLLRDVVQSELSPDSANSLHEHAADAYQRAFASSIEEEAARIGYHLAAAGQFDRAADFYATSGLHFLTVRRLDRAVSDLTYALLMADLDHRGGPQIGNWVRALANAVRHVHSGPELPALIERMKERLETDTRFDARLKIQLAVDLAMIMSALDQFRAAEALIESHTEQANRWAKAERSLLAARAEMATAQGQLRRAVAALNRAGELPPTDSVDEHRLLVALALTRAGAGDAAGARAALTRAESVAAADDAVQKTERLRAQAIILARSGRFRQAAEVATEAAAEATELGLFYEAALSESIRALAWIRLDELPRANEAIEAALELALEVGAPRIVGQARMLAAYAAALATDGANPTAIQEFLDLAEAEEWTIDALQARFLLGKLAARRGDQVAARRYWTQAAEAATATDNRVLADECHTELTSLGK